MNSPRIPEIPHWLPGALVAAMIAAGLALQAAGYSWGAL